MKVIPRTGRTEYGQMLRKKGVRVCYMEYVNPAIIEKPWSG
jgi:hypothetical protein